MACKFYFNDSESILYNEILKAYDGDEELSNTLYSYFSSKEFLNNFGDWKKDYNEGYSLSNINYHYIDDTMRIDENGEPALFKDESSNYYYIDKDKNREYVIFNSKSLISLFSYSETAELTKVLAFNFVKNNLNLDFENLDSSKGSNITLRKSIIDKLSERINTFNKSEDYLWENKAELLQSALDNNLDEIENNVINYFKQSKLNYNQNLNDTELENIEIAENDKDPGFNLSSMERSTKDNISANVKLRLSLIEDTSEKDYFLNDVTYVHFDDIYSTLLHTLNSKVALDLENDQQDLFEIYKGEILKLSSKKPYFKELYRLLSKDSLSEDIKSEFTQAFNLDKNIFNTTVLKEDNNKLTHNVLNVANVGAKENMIFNEWNVNFKELFLELNKENKLIFPTSKIKTLKDILSDLNLLKETKDVNLLINSLRKLGVETTQEGFNHYLDNLKLVNKDEQLSEEIFNKTIKDLSFFINNIINNNIKNFSLVFNNQSIFRDIAKAEAFFKKEGSDSSVFTAGKQKWTFSYPTYLSTTVKSWKEDRNVLLNHYNSSVYTQGSDWMKYLLAIGNTYEVDEFLSSEEQESKRIEESKKRIQDINIGSFNVLQEDENSVEGVSNTEIDQLSYTADTINKILAFQKNEKSFYRTTTPADKSTQYELYIGRNHSTNARYNDELSIVVNDSVTEVIFDYFNTEYKRMKFEKEFIDNEKNKDELITYYHLGNKNALNSQLFPNLSSQNIVEEMQKFGNENDFSAIYDKNGNAYLNDLNNSVFKPLILKYINKTLSDNIIQSLNTLTNEGIFEIVDNQYTNKKIDYTIWNKYENNNALKITSDFYINSVISHIEYSKMFSGDIAFYKNAVDYKKRLPATYTDGLQLRLNDLNKSYNVAVTESVEIASPFISEIEELVGNDIANYYKNINSADAQAWITPQRWKMLMSSLGKWNPTYDSVYSKLTGLNNESFTLEELKKVAPPLKGVYFQNVNGRPVFLKYSQAVLSPRLRKGNDLEKLYNQMVIQNIDELVTFDAIKVGSNKPTLVNNTEGRVLDNIVFNVMNLPSDGWKLQQDLPVKTFKETELGSQIQKNIFQGLSFNLNETFTLNDDEFSGNEILQQISSIVGELSDRGLQSVIREFGIDSDNIITNTKGFYNSIIDELKERGGSNNIIKALEAETSIYGLPQAQSKLQNIFASIIKSRVLKIKTNGGSFIQMSNFGLNKENAEAQDVIWSPKALSTTHEPHYLKDENGEFKLSENGKKIIRPGGILISGSFIAKYIPDYKKYSAEELFDNIIDKKILENIIGYRIPNQGLSSNDALEIVGILPEENGDTVVAYTGITTKTGSDYDIDKMYIMFPSYTFNKNKLIYDEFQKDTDLSNQSLGSVQNRLIELYKSVLLNENVIQDVMTPIDFDHMKKDIRSIFEQKKETNLSIFDPLKDIDTKYSFLAGKAGVGQEANSLMDYVLGSLTNITISNFILPKSNNDFDIEYSAELDNKDKTYYQKELNLSNEEMNGLEKIKISHSLSAILNAFVDIAKDPYITEGNWVTMTTNTGNLLIRKGVHPFYVNSFLAQPIIKQYIDFTAQYENNNHKQSLNTKDEFRKEFVKSQLESSSLVFRGQNLKYSDIYDLTFEKSDIKFSNQEDIQKGINSFNTLNILSKLKYPKDLSLSNDEVLNFKTLERKITEEHSIVFFNKKGNIFSNNLKTLRDQIFKSDSDFQANVLNEFLYYQSVSKIMKENIDASKFMVNSIGKNVTSLAISKNLVSNIFDKEQLYLNDNSSSIHNLLNFEDKFKNPNGTESMFAKYYKNNILEIDKIVKANPKLFLSANERVQNTFNEISYSINNTILLDDILGTQLEKDFYSYVMSGFTPFNLTVEERRSLINNLPQEFKEFKEENEGLYEIIDQLNIKTGELLNFITLSNRKKSKEFEDSLINSWYDLLNEEPEFAEKLIKYSFFTSGFSMNLGQFFTYIPSEWLIRNKINRYVIDTSNMFSNLEANLDNFTDQFFMSNINNRKIVKNTLPYMINDKGTFTQLSKGFVLKQEGPNSYFKARVLENETLYYKLLGYNNELKPVYSRYVYNISDEFVDVRDLNYKDNKGNKIVNFYTAGLILRPSDNLKKDTEYYEKLLNQVIYPRNTFFNQNFIDQSLKEIEEGINEEIDSINEENKSPCKGGINI